MIVVIDLKTRNILDHSMSIVITGGGGDLAQEIVKVFQKKYTLSAPKKQELDVTDPAKVQRFFDKREVDLLICNAGITDDNLLLKMTEKSWDKVLNTNLKGSFLCADACLPSMAQRQRGHVIFINSFSAFHPPAGQAHYAAAKAGLTGLTDSFAKNYGKNGVRVNQICPGWLETKMTAKITEKRKQEVLEKHALRQFNTAASVAHFLLYLHENLPFTSGQTFHLDSRCVTGNN